LEPILKGQLREHASDAVSMFFGPKGCIEHILVPLGFELSLTLKVCKFIHFLCNGFGLWFIKMWLAIHYLRLPCFNPEPATISKALKRVRLPCGYYSFSFTPPLIGLPLVSPLAKTDFMYIVHC